MEPSTATKKINIECDKTPTLSAEAEMPHGLHSEPTDTQSVGPIEASNSDGEAINSLSKDTKEKLFITRKKLSGAAVKRRRWLIRNGADPEQARTLALQPMKRIGKNNGGAKSKTPAQDRVSNTNSGKRARSDGSTPESVPQKRKATEASEPVAGTSKGVTAPKMHQHKSDPKRAKKSYGQVAGSTKVGIMHTNFPESLLEEGQMQTVQDKLMDLIFEERTGATKPQFLNASFRPGWLLLNCANSASAEWVRERVSHLKPWEGATLKAVNEEDIPHPQILSVVFPRSVELKNEVILGTLEGQNNDISTAKWRIIKREPQNTSILLVISADPISFESLKRKDFLLHYRFGQVQFRTRNPNKGQTGKGAPEAEGVPKSRDDQ